jgi:hypothetical protein
MALLKVAGCIDNARRKEPATPRFTLLPLELVVIV